MGSETVNTTCFTQTITTDTKMN